MPSSALSGNIQGLASASSPGVVGTGAQTFAGKKTLDGGALIKGDTSGVAIASGYVGEKITWTIAPANQALTTTEADWTNANIVLTAGNWLVQANIYIDANTLATAGNYATSRIKITDSSNTVVSNCYKVLYIVTPAAAALAVTQAMPFSFVANLATTTTYKIRVFGDRSGGGSTGTAHYNTTGNASEFFAIRIA